MDIKARIEKIETQTHERRETKPKMMKVCHTPADEKKALKEFAAAKGKYSGLRIYRITTKDFSRKGTSRQKA